MKTIKARIWADRDIGWMAAGLTMIGIFIGICAACLLVMTAANAEEGDCWVICKPGDYINIRQRPTTRAEATGYAEAGMMFRTDFDERNGFIHLVGVTENGEGWIHAGYVVFCEPRQVNAEMTVAGCRRAALRARIDGKRKAWANSGQKLTVYWIGDGWALTNRGFIMSEYLEE